MIIVIVIKIIVRKIVYNSKTVTIEIVTVIMVIQ